MKKMVKRIGNSVGVIFSQEEREIYGFGLFDVIDIEIKKVTKKK